MFLNGQTPVISVVFSKFKIKLSNIVDSLL